MGYRPAVAKAKSGFTLIEMMVVLTLLGLVTTLALPAMQRWHDAARARAQLATLVGALRAASFAASAERRDLTLDELSFHGARSQDGLFQVDVPSGAIAGTASASAAASGSLGTARDTAADGITPTPQMPYTSRGRVSVALPAGWRVDTVTPARFYANGLCDDGSVSLLTEQGHRVSVSIKGPLCEIDTGTTGR